MLGRPSPGSQDELTIHRHSKQSAFFDQVYNVIRGIPKSAAVLSRLAQGSRLRATWTTPRRHAIRCVFDIDHIRPANSPSKPTGCHPKPHQTQALDFDVFSRVRLSLGGLLSTENRGSGARTLVQREGGFEVCNPHNEPSSGSSARSSMFAGTKVVIAAVLPVRTLCR